MATKNLVMSMGTVNMWGFSPGFDMLDGVANASKSREPAPQASNSIAATSNSLAAATPEEPIRVLLVGAGDIRHVLATIAHRCQRHNNGTNRVRRPVHIYMYEKSIEVLARHSLLLQIALDTDVPLRQRCNLFLEVFGNARVQRIVSCDASPQYNALGSDMSSFAHCCMQQERTSAYIEEKAKSLIDLLHNERGLLANVLDLSHLKMRTRDELIETFQSWFQRVRFDVDTLRDHRLRHFYEVRYDYRNNLIDWDYTMVLKKIEHASVIHIRQFRDWRNSGIAFEFGDQTYTEPNRSMAAYTQAHKKHHGSVLCRGLWTDIVVGPFVSFGIQVDSSHKLAQQLLEIHNKGTGVEQNRHNTVEVAVFNVLSYLYAIETGAPYVMTKAHDVYSGIGETAATTNDLSALPLGEASERFIELTDDDNNDNVSDARKLDNDAQQQSAESIDASLDGVSIVLLTGELEDLAKRKRYARQFDHVFLASQHTHVLAPELKQSRESSSVDASDALASDERKWFTDLLADSAAVSIESSVFLLPLQEDQRVMYVAKLLELAQQHVLVPQFTFANGTSAAPTRKDLSSLDAAVLQFCYARPAASSSAANV